MKFVVRFDLTSEDTIELCLKQELPSEFSGVFAKVSCEDIVLSLKCPMLPIKVATNWREQRKESATC
jgi:hypothetical protein